MATASKLWAFDAPKIATPKGLIFPGGGDEIVTMPCGAFLIEHPRGLVLVDTMLDPAGQGDIPGRYGPLEWLFSEYLPEQTVQANLAKLGLSLGDVTHVVSSHLHFDHAGSLGLLGHAKLYVGRGEITHAMRPPRPDPFYDPRDVAGVDAYATRFEVGQDHDLFDDGAVTLLHLPGHTPGQLALLVRLPAQNILLGCDIVHDIDAYHAEVPMMADYDTVTAVDSIRRAKLIVDATNARVIISHFTEPDVPILPEYVC
ncbi:MAG TPA: N-acyl homoserine lactonase family protein [Solirubrobacteraceae bacterium]|nr:N-acyl homoserine lactonase family protein [Solirubrobacteraceae bacterium]